MSCASEVAWQFETRCGRTVAPASRACGRRRGWAGGDKPTTKTTSQYPRSAWLVTRRSLWGSFGVETCMHRHVGVNVYSWRFHVATMLHYPTR